MSNSIFDVSIKAVLDGLSFIKALGMEDRVEALNAIRERLHELSPFKSEPVDFVRWVPSDTVHANDYNPNSVAPPEMELLRLSIMHDGYTQPIVGNKDDVGYEVVDGFHRNRVGKEMADVRNRVHGYLPVVQIRESQMDVSDRMAATIRHNRARGKHRVEAMSEIVIELKRRNWSDDKIAKNLGMEQDEILRLCQISGLTELFGNQEFSQAWDVEGDVTEADYIEFGDDFDKDEVKVRTVNTGDEDRVFHPFSKWECYKAGFYATGLEGKQRADCEHEYAEFLANDDMFRDALEHVVAEWKHSCEHYLTNRAMNRIAYLGQAAAAYALGLPSVYRGGYFLLDEAQKERANQTALEYLNKWLIANGREAVTMEQADPGRQADIY
jgi:ParB-like chromosome segregation protein Spo0J